MGILPSRYSPCYAYGYLAPFWTDEIDSGAFAFLSRIDRVGRSDSGDTGPISGRSCSFGRARNASSGCAYAGPCVREVVLIG